MQDSYDVVVIGSGFGGSILGCRLAQAGRSVCILERGRRWSNTEFPRSPSQIARDQFWDMGAARFGLGEYRAFRGMHVVQGSGVGGGSLHYFNVHVRAPSVFDDPRCCIVAPSGATEILHQSQTRPRTRGAPPPALD